MSDEASLLEARRAISRCRRLVVKVGSKALAADRQIYDRFADAVSTVQTERRRVTIVSSGAIALGARKMGLTARPKETAWLQAAAAAGQSVLMRFYEEAFARRDLLVAQVLLTYSDLSDRARANNARNALHALFDAKVVPIINENDTVAIDELRFGDNDQLAAMVAPLVSADLLVLLSDVPGLLDKQGERVRLVRNIAREARPLAGGSTSGVGTGGMASKIEAARRAMLAGCTVVIADARHPSPLQSILDGEDVGTVFLPYAQRIHARKHWIAFTLRPKGAVVLDRGATEAVATRGRSVLPVGVLGVRGEFDAGDAVLLLSPEGREIGRGLARMGSTQTAAVAGKHGPDLAAMRGQECDGVVVHRDDLVLSFDDDALTT